MGAMAKAGKKGIVGDGANNPGQHIDWLVFPIGRQILRPQPSEARNAPLGPAKSASEPSHIVWRPPANWSLEPQKTKGWGNPVAAAFADCQVRPSLFHRRLE